MRLTFFKPFAEITLISKVLNAIATRKEGFFFLVEKVGKVAKEMKSFVFYYEGKRELCVNAKWKSIGEEREAAQ